MKKLKIVCLFSLTFLLAVAQLKANVEQVPTHGENQEISQEVGEVVDSNEPNQSEEKKYFSAGNEATIESQLEFLQACRCGCDKDEDKEDVKRNYENSLSQNLIYGSAPFNPTRKALKADFTKKAYSNVRNQYTTTHRDAILYPLLVGGEVQLDDYSVWTIEPLQSYLTLAWTTVDQIVVRVNPGRWNGIYYEYSPYKYILENIDKNVSVEANLSRYLDPIYHGVKNHTIEATDSIGCYIWLNDGSVWSVDWWDFTSRWKKGHTVIIGVNADYKKATKQNILINASLIEHVRASCIR